MRLGRIWILACCAIVAGAVDARADLLAIPFVGATFKAQTTLKIFDVPTVDPSALSSSVVLGVAGMWLSHGILGVEGELAYAPSFLKLEGKPALVGSNITTFTGNLVLTAPLSLTRESLRPYFVGGLGLLHVGVADRINLDPLDPVDRNLLALSLGGGVIGMVSDVAGLRFDLRQVRSVGDVSLSYWRATAGVTIRY